MGHNVDSTSSLEELAQLKKKLQADEETSRSLILQLIAIRHDIADTRSKIDRCEDALQTSYISILPSDILFLIFSTVTTDSFDSDQVLCLSHVCRQWREMTISMPVLWAKKVFISACDWYCKSRPLFELYMERARQCPLDIVFEEGDFKRADPSGNSGDAHYQARNDLISCMSRCRKLELCIWDSSSKFIEYLADVSAPSLESLVVYSHYDWEDESYETPTEILRGGAPRLSSLALTRIWPDSLVIGGSSDVVLTSLHMSVWLDHDLDRQPLVDHLRGTHLLKLETLELDSPWYNIDLEDSVPVELKRLSFLEVVLYLESYQTRDEVRNTVVAILSKIKAPILHHLVLDLRNTPEYLQTEPLRSSINDDLPAFPMLQKLTIKVHPSISGHRALPSLSRLFPNITHLEVMGSDEEDSDVRLLIEIRPIIKALCSEVDWPLLRQVTLIGIRSEENLGDLIQFAHERKRAGYPPHKMVLVGGTAVINRWLLETLEHVSRTFKFSDVLDMDLHPVSVTCAH